VSVHLNVSQVPQLENWGFRAKELITLWSPRIVRILDIEDCHPHNIDLTIQKSDDGIAFADSNAITVSSHWVEKYPEDIGLIVHEAVHVVQLYPEFEPGWVTEGIADYIRWHLYEKKLLEWFPIGEDEKGCEAAYRTTGGFFLWITIHKNADFIKILNTSMKNGEYEDSIFLQNTGNDLDALWHEYFQYRKANP
jgi:hypothetical protein